jgi:hypothetical protein
MGKDKREPEEEPQEEGNQRWKMTFTKEITETSHKRDMAASLGSPISIGNEHSEGGKQDDKEKMEKEYEREAEKKAQWEEWNRRWKTLAYKARMTREIVPGLFLGNVEASLIQPSYICSKRIVSTL